MKKVSRGPNIDVELCVENGGGNRFELVLIGAARARELRKECYRGNDCYENRSGAISALLEIEAGKIGREYLSVYKKQLERPQRDRNAKIKRV